MGSSTRRDDYYVRLRRTRRRRRVQTFKRTTTMDVYSHATARRMRRRVRLHARSDDGREHPPREHPRRLPRGSAAGRTRTTSVLANVVVRPRTMCRRITSETASEKRRRAAETASRNKETETEIRSYPQGYGARARTATGARTGARLFRLADSNSVAKP